MARNGAPTTQKFTRQPVAPEVAAERDARAKRIGDDIGAAYKRARLARETK